MKSRRKAPPFPFKKATAATRAWWRTVWASPMAEAYLDVDVFPLTRLCALVERVNQGALSAQLLAEMRQLETALGLTPLARRKLEWEIADPEARPEPAAAASDHEDGRWLRAVN